jgi:hypothetical protein
LRARAVFAFGSAWAAPFALSVVALAIRPL